MTLVPEAAIGGRRFAVAPDGWICCECRKETPASRDCFAAHVCASAAAPPPDDTTAPPPDDTTPPADEPVTPKPRARRGADTPQAASDN
jgi:hypothetical protein